MQVVISDFHSALEVVCVVNLSVAYFQSMANWAEDRRAQLNLRTVQKIQEAFEAIAGENTSFFDQSDKEPDAKTAAGAKIDDLSAGVRRRTLGLQKHFFYLSGFCFFVSFSVIVLSSFNTLITIGGGVAIVGLVLLLVPLPLHLSYLSIELWIYKLRCRSEIKPFVKIAKRIEEHKNGQFDATN